MSEHTSSDKQPSETHASAQVLVALLQSKFQAQIVELGVERGDVVIRIDRDSILSLFKLVKLDSDLRLDYLVSVTAVDWLDSALSILGRENTERFELVYHLLSLSKRYRLRVKVWVPEEQPEVDSLVPLWRGANFMEREVWDMYGIRFRGHPDLRRILMYDEFEGHPLRKDYPVQGKQPRIPLRHPEVRNTALDMKRADLVTISPRKKREGGA